MFITYSKPEQQIFPPFFSGYGKKSQNKDGMRQGRPCKLCKYLAQA